MEHDTAPSITSISFYKGDGYLGWGGVPYYPEPPRFPFGWPEEDKYRAVLEKKYSITPGQVIVSVREGDFVKFSRRELKGVYYYYTPLETIPCPVKKLRW